MHATTTAYLSVFAVLLIAGPSQARAQSAVPGAPVGATRPAIEERVAVDSFLALVPNRREARIDSLIDLAGKRERAAARRRFDTDLARRRAREAGETQQLEIDRATRLIRVAEDMDRDDRKAGLEHERRLRERYRDLIGIRIEALEHEMAVADAEERYAVATGSRLAVERELAADRLRWRSEGPAAELERAIQDALERYFEAVREEERERESVARARQALADAQLRVLQGRRDLVEN